MKQRSFQRERSSVSHPSCCLLSLIVSYSYCNVGFCVKYGPFIKDGTFTILLGPSSFLCFRHSLSFVLFLFFSQSLLLKYCSKELQLKYTIFVPLILKLSILQRNNDTHTISVRSTQVVHLRVHMMSIQDEQGKE